MTANSRVSFGRLSDAVDAYRSLSESFLVLLEAVRDIANYFSVTHGDCAAKVLDENRNIALVALAKIKENSK